MHAIISGIEMIAMQLAYKYLNLDLTKAQLKIIQHPISQMVILFFMFYLTCNNIWISAILVIGYQITIYVLLNEAHPLNIYSKYWLIKEGFMKEDTIQKIKENYKMNINVLKNN